MPMRGIQPKGISRTAIELAAENLLKTFNETQRTAKTFIIRSQLISWLENSKGISKQTSLMRIRFSIKSQARRGALPRATEHIRENIILCSFDLRVIWQISQPSHCVPTYKSSLFLWLIMAYYVTVGTASSSTWSAISALEDETRIWNSNRMFVFNQVNYSPAQRETLASAASMKTSQTNTRSENKHRKQLRRDCETVKNWNWNLGGRQIENIIILRHSKRLI